MAADVLNELVREIDKLILTIDSREEFDEDQWLLALCVNADVVRSLLNVIRLPPIEHPEEFNDADPFAIGPPILGDGREVLPAIGLTMPGPNFLDILYSIEPPDAGKIPSDLPTEPPK